MCVRLTQAEEKDLPLIHEMQRRAFLPLLARYQDEETSPAQESLERIGEKYHSSDTTYYLILYQGTPAGAVRVADCAMGVYRIAPLFVLPEYQGRGIATQAVGLLERTYPEALKWTLDTILQEGKTCCLYEKLGYIRTGRIERVNERMDIVYYQKAVVGLDGQQGSKQSPSPV